MTTDSLSSERYRGITVFYSYAYSSEMVHYTCFKDFNGATPSDFSIEIQDVKAGEISIYDYL